LARPTDERTDETDDEVDVYGRSARPTIQRTVFEDDYDATVFVVAVFANSHAPRVQLARPTADDVDVYADDEVDVYAAAAAASDAPPAPSPSRPAAAPSPSRPAAEVTSTRPTKGVVAARQPARVQTGVLGCGPSADEAADAVAKNAVRVEVTGLSVRGPASTVRR
jgi:hypothetical protein